MERMTFEREGYVFLEDEYAPAQAYRKLAAYERLGRTPEECAEALGLPVAEAKDRKGWLCHCSECTRYVSSSALGDGWCKHWKKQMMPHEFCGAGRRK